MGGAVLAGGFASLWADIAGSVFGGSMLAEGVMGGAFTAYNEIAWPMLAAL